MKKEHHIRSIAWRLVLTPFLGLWAFIILSVFVVPFLYPKLNAFHVRLIMAFIALTVTALILWLPFVLNMKKNRNDLLQVEQIGKIMFQFDLNYEEALVINQAEGWDYAKIVGEKLPQDQLKAAFEFSQKLRINENTFRRRRDLIIMILSFVMASFGFAGLLQWKTNTFPPIVSGGLLTSVGLYFLFSYIQGRKNNHFE